MKRLQTWEEQERASVIATLEQALIEAKVGEVVAVAVSMVGPYNPEKPSQVGYLSSEPSRYQEQLIAAVGLTHWRLCEQMWHGPDNKVITEDLDPPA